MESILVHIPLGVDNMNADEFQKFLKRQRRKESAIGQITKLVADFHDYLNEYYQGRSLDQVTTDSLETYVSWFESESGESASKPLWAVRYYFDFIENKELSNLAGELRAERIKRKPFFIRNFRGVDSEQVEILESHYIENIDQMLDEGRTPALRKALSEKTGIPLVDILEFVKLSDLARLGAVRSVRARLYHDAGFIPQEIAKWNPEDLHKMLVEWVEKTAFDGIAPFPKEVQCLVKDARKLPPLVQY